jgi:hypothetical protein
LALPLTLAFQTGKSYHTNRETCAICNVSAMIAGSQNYRYTEPFLHLGLSFDTVRFMRQEVPSAGGARNVSNVFLSAFGAAEDKSGT